MRKKEEVPPVRVDRENALTAEKEAKKKLQIDLSVEKEVYRIASEHKSRETWPDCVFDELFEIKKQTKEINLKVCERFCVRSGINDQASALLKAWKDHNTGEKRKAR